MARLCYLAWITFIVFAMMPVQAVAETRDPESFFFDESFGSFNEELEKAKEEGKRGILIMLQQDEFPYCQRMRATLLLVLAKSGVMGATALQPQTAINSVRIGQNATVMIGEKTFSARVSALAKQADPQGEETRYRLEVAFEPAADDVFRAGQPATISLP